MDRKEYRRKYREANREVLKEKNALHYAKNKERYRELNKEWREKNPEKMRIIRHRWQERHPERNLLKIAKMRAITNKIDFNLEEADIVIPAFCPVLGIKLKWTRARGRTQPDTPSIDRFDNRFGYVKGNVRVISWRANRLKSDGTLKEFENIIRYMKS